MEELKEKKSNELKDFILNNYNVEIQRSMYFIKEKKENMRPIYEELFKENKNILYFLEAVKQLAYIGMYNEYDEKGNVVGQFPDEDYCIVKSSVEQYYDLEKLKLMVDKIPKENLSENEKENIKLLKNAVDKNPMDEELEEDYYEDY